MTSAVRVIRIYVSSPGDVREEREVLASVVAELQQTIAPELGVFLELIRWEDTAVPGLGRAQELINQQLPVTDIFVGILWTRFGTPVREGKSGTEDEFLRALDSWRLLGRPHVLFYFCDRPVSPTHADIQQLSKVQDFRRTVGERALYWTYDDVTEFRHIVRQHVIGTLTKLLGLVPQARRTPRLFYSYAHEDTGLREEMAKHLRVLERNRVIHSWYDNMIAPGVEWSREIADQLRQADIIVLLVSSDFLDSDYCYTVEMEQALERHRAGTARVVPIILRPVLWEESPLAALQALPKAAKPITLWSNRDEAWTDVARGIKRVCDELAAENAA